MLCTHYLKVRATKWSVVSPIFRDDSTVSIQGIMLVKNALHSFYCIISVENIVFFAADIIFILLFLYDIFIYFITVKLPFPLHPCFLEKCFLLLSVHGVEVMILRVFRVHEFNGTLQEGIVLIVERHFGYILIFLLPLESFIWWKVDFNGLSVFLRVSIVLVPLFQLLIEHLLLTFILLQVLVDIGFLLDLCYSYLLLNFEVILRVSRRVLLLYYLRNILLVLKRLILLVLLSIYIRFKFSLTYLLQPLFITHYRLLFVGRLVLSQIEIESLVLYLRVFIHIFIFIKLWCVQLLKNLTLYFDSILSQVCLLIGSLFFYFKCNQIWVFVLSLLLIDFIIANISNCEWHVQVLLTLSLVHHLLLLVLPLDLLFDFSKSLLISLLLLLQFLESFQFPLFVLLVNDSLLSCLFVLDVFQHLFSRDVNTHFWNLFDPLYVRFLAHGRVRQVHNLIYGCHRLVMAFANVRSCFLQLVTIYIWFFRICLHWL